MIFENKDFLITLTGASGSGKSTIERMLVNQHGLKRAISHTTRKMRINEQPGVDYYFIDKSIMKKLLSEGKLAECIEYNENMYGVTIDELMKSEILVVEPLGLLEVKDRMKDKKTIISIFLEVSPEIARERMINRGDQKSNVDARIEKDSKHFNIDAMPDKGSRFDYFVNTNNLKPSQVAETIVDILLNHNSKKEIGEGND